jgi:predicted ribosomally synthesized peptide with nif11-like leader
MSVEQARLFIERMKSDEAFAKRVLAIEDVAARLACIQSEGFDCSEAEIKGVSGELSDEELDRAAGGHVYMFAKTNSTIGYIVNNNLM